MECSESGEDASVNAKRPTAIPVGPYWTQIMKNEVCILLKCLSQTQHIYIVIKITTFDFGTKQKLCLKKFMPLFAQS